MKQFNYKSNDDIEWNITITYDSKQDIINTGNEVVLVQSNDTTLRFTYPFQPVDLKFKIEPTKTDVYGNITYGYLKYDDNVVCSFDPNV